MKVLFLLNIPSPNRVDFFNEFGKLCELTVLFETEASTERDESWKNYQFKNFQGIILPGKRMSLDTAFCPFVIKYLDYMSEDFMRSREITCYHKRTAGRSVFCRLCFFVE